MSDLFIYELIPN